MSENPDNQQPTETSPITQNEMLSADIVLPPSVNGRDRFILIEKKSPETINPLVKREVSVEAIVEIIDRNFSYPMAAHVGLKFDSRTFSNIPSKKFDVKMKKVKVPSNYYPTGGNGLDRRYVYPNPDYDADPNTLDVIFMVDQNMNFATRALLKRNLKDTISKLISGYKYIRASIWQTSNGTNTTINEKTGDIINNFTFFSDNGDFFEVETPDSDGANNTNLYKKLFDALSSTQISTNPDETIIANYFLRKTQFSITDTVGKSSEGSTLKRVWENTVRKVIYFSGSTPETMTQNTYDTLLSHARENCVNIYYFHNDSDFSGTRTLRELAEDTGGGKFCMLHDSDVKLTQFCNNNFYDSNKIYYGDWDGTFKIAWTDNPAWVLYDIITDPNYGLGNYIDSKAVDKWTLYDIGRYCDCVDDDGRFRGVPDGKGGLEPRYTCNIIFYNKDEAYNVLKDISAVFKGILYWTTEGFSFFADMPKQAVMQFANSSVKDGVFNYEDTAKNLRYTCVEVTYNDRYDFYKPKIEYVEDSEGIVKYGLNPFKVNAAGCTSRSEAKRIGRYVMSTSMNESEVVTFTAGIEGSYLQIGDLFIVSDEIKNVARTFGRILDVDSANKTIKIDGEFQQGLSSGIFVHIPSGNYKVSDLNALNDASGNFTGTLENIRARRQSQLKQLNIKQVQDDAYGCTLTVTGNFLMDSVITDVHLEERRISGAFSTGESILTGIVYRFPENTIADGNPTWDTLSYQQVTGVFNEVGLDVDLIGEAGTGQLIAPVASNWLGKIDYKVDGSNSFFYTNGSAQVQVNTNVVAIAEISAANGSSVNSGSVSNLDDVWGSSVYTSASTGNIIAIFTRGPVISNSYVPSNNNWNNLAATEVFKIGKNISATSTSFGYAAAFIKGGYRIIERASKNTSDQGSLTFYYRDLLALSKLRPYYTISQADIGNNQATKLKDWTFDFGYRVGDRVKNNGNVYLCVQDHKSPTTFEVGNKWTAGNSLGYSTYGFPKNFYVKNSSGNKVPITDTLTSGVIASTFNSLGISNVYVGNGTLGETNLATLAEGSGLGYSGLVYGTGYPIGYYNLNVDTSARNLDSLSAGSSYVLSGSGVEPKYYKTIATKEEEANQYGIVGLQYMPDKESFVEREIADSSPSQYVVSPYDKIIKPDPVSSITSTGIFGGTGLDVTWQQVTSTPINGYKIYVSRPDYSNSNDSALTEFFAVPSGTNKVTIPINGKWGQYDIDVYAQGITPYKFLSDGAASIDIQVLPQPTLQIGGITVNSVMVSGIKLDTADIDSLRYNIGYKSSDSCFTGVGVGNFTSADLTFRWKYIDPTGGIVSNIDQMRRNPFIEFPPKVTLEIVNEGGAVLETVKQYQGFSYRIDENANKQLVNREQSNYQNVQASRNLGLRIKIEDINGKSFTGIYQASNIPPSYKDIEVIDSYQDSPYQILSGIYGNQSYQRLAVWNSGTNNIVTGSGLRDSAGSMLRSEDERDVSYGDIVSAFLKATGFNGIAEGSTPSVAGITINYRGDGDPDYEAYVNLYGDLLDFYNKNIDKSKSKEEFGLEHYTVYGGPIENREVPKTKNNPMGIADLDAVPTGKIGFSGIAMTVLPEKVSFNKLVFNCSSAFSNKDVYKVDIYTGDVSGFSPDTSKKTNYHREYLMTDTRRLLNIIELSDESIDRSKWYYYKFLPYDDFGTGIMSAVCSGYLVNEEREAITKSYKKKTLNGNADEGEISAADMTQDIRYKIVSLGTINWNQIGLNADTVAEINVEFEYNGEAITGSNGVVQRIEKPEIITPTEMDILHVFNTNSNSTVVVPEDVVEGSSLNFVNIGEHDIYVNNPDGDTANGENITVLKPNERVELFKINGVWIDPRGDNLYLD